MNKGLIFTILILAAAAANAAQTGKNSAEYKEAYRCATESFKENASGPASYCVGNSRDPSRLELKAYADAERDLKSGAASKKTAGACSFGYGSWVADGSRADDFLEGPQKPRRCAKWLNSFRGAQSGFSTSMASPFQWIL